jgi:hypothetical protein
VTHRPLDKAEVEEGVRAEVLELPDQLRRYFSRVAVEVRAVEFPDKTVFIVAKSGNRAIYYDGVEEEYGIGAIDGEALKVESVVGELRLALLALQDGRSGR